MKHIYIIEDDAGILDGLTFLLSDNYRITAISDARIALDMLNGEQPDLILVDLLMPCLNGAEFIKKVNQKKLKIPILVMTASVNISIQLKGLTFAGIIHKPFEIEEIEKRIDSLLKQSRANETVGLRESLRSQ